MKVVLLGTVGYRPNDARHTPCILLPELGVMLDAGTGLYRCTEYLQTDTLDIFLTHAHLDHVFGLTVLFDVLHVRMLERITVHAEAAKLQALDVHLFNEHLFPVRSPYVPSELTGPVTLADGGTLSYFPVEHPGGCVSYRLDWPDRSMAYVSDTTATQDAPYIEKIRGVDLLIHECHLKDGNDHFAEVTGHSSITPVAQVARQAGVGRLVLMHFNPLYQGDDPIGVETAREIFPNTDVGYDRMEIDF